MDKDSGGGAGREEFQIRLSLISLFQIRFGCQHVVHEFVWAFPRNTICLSVDEQLSFLLFLSLNHRNNLTAQAVFIKTKNLMQQVSSV